MLFLLIALLSLIVQFLGPWWTIAPVAVLLGALLAKSARHAFWSGFLAIALVWVLMALFHSIPNEHLLAGRIAQMLGLPARAGYWMVVVALTGVIGGLTGGLGSLTGYFWRKALRG